MRPVHAWNATRPPANLQFVVIAIVGILIAGAMAGLIVGITLAVQNKQKDKDQTG